MIGNAQCLVNDVGDWYRLVNRHLCSEMHRAGLTMWGTGTDLFEEDHAKCVKDEDQDAWY